MTITSCCPGCGERVPLAAVVCYACRDFLPGTVKQDLDSSADNPALVPLVLPAVMQALAQRPIPQKVKPGPSTVRH